MSASLAWVSVEAAGRGPTVLAASAPEISVNEINPGEYLVTFPGRPEISGAIGTLNNSMGMVTAIPGSRSGLAANQVHVFTLTSSGSASGSLDFTLTAYFGRSSTRTGPVDIRELGADPGRRDNGQPIQEAIDSGLPVYIPALPPGQSYKYNTTLVLPRSVAADDHSPTHCGSKTIFGDGRSSLLEFTGTGIAIDATVHPVCGPAHRTSLSRFRITASSPRASVALRIANAYMVTINEIEIGGHDAGGREGQYWTEAAIFIEGTGQGEPPNAAAVRIVNCNILGCRGDGIRVRDEVGAGGLYFYGNRIQANYGVGVNQLFPSRVGPGAKSQLYVICNVIEGNQAAQIWCDCLRASVFLGNHLENSQTPKTEERPRLFPPSSLPLIRLSGRKWRGRQGELPAQHYGVSIIGNQLQGVWAPCLIECESGTASHGFVIVGNDFLGEVWSGEQDRPLGAPYPVAAVSLSAHTNIAPIEGNHGAGRWEIFPEWKVTEVG